jgi:crotonobetainyl-CoA:carnitine CoA-transferase CaiB-like acyl-CoA transferase
VKGGFSVSEGAPLSHKRVLDLSRLVPGPYCSLILADFGAEVIKIERPTGGDWLRNVPPLDPESGEGQLYRILNRGKKSLTLNLKTQEGRDILLRLVERADVLLESFRPGVMQRLELGYEALARANGRLVYCSLSGYGSSGPYRDRAGHDLNYIGVAGLLDLTGLRDGPPVIPGVPVADLTGGLWAAVGVLMALFARETTGKGQRVDASLLGGALACMPLALARHRGGDRMERGISDLSGGWVCYNVYQTGDGQHMTLAALEPHFWAAFCQAVAREDLIGEQFAPAVPGGRAYDELCALFRSRTRQQWIETFSGNDACCEPVYTMGEATASAPVQALGMLVGEGLLPPVQLSAQTLVASQPAPRLGEHTVPLLTELGYDDVSVSALRERGVI